MRADINSLTQDEIDQFNEDGYLVFEGLFDDDHNQRIKSDVDKLMEDRKHSNEEHIIMGYPELGLLTSEPSIVDRVANWVCSPFGLIDNQTFCRLQKAASKLQSIDYVARILCCVIG